MNIKQCIAATLIAALATPALARDKSGDNWYFGTNGGVTFVSGSPLPLAGGQITTTEGCATISDTDGNLLFYTDGSTVYNASHGVMPNGTGLLGNSSASQSGIIVPKPGSSTVYYVFTVPVSCNVGLNYSVVDLTLDSGNGDVVNASKNTQLLASSTEVVTVAVHSNGEDYWVIARKCGTNSFSAFQISSAGINATPVETSTGTTCGSSEIGYLKASPNGDRLGMSFYFGNTAEYYDFDASTGKVTNAKNLGTINGAYGFEFSPDGTKIYVAPYSGELAQYNLEAANVVASRTALGTPGSAIGAIQNGSDGKTYFALSGQSYLGVINQPNTAGASCGYQEVGPTISGTCTIGLPTFIPAFFASTAAPTVTTTAASNIEATTADSGGNVTDDGGATVTARGVCWNTTGTPTTSDDKTTDGTGTGEFTSELTGLSPETAYYVRAYAVNSVGTSYGSEKTFTTEAAAPDLQLTITSPTASANVGDELQFGIQIQNAGNGSASNVVLWFDVPAGTEFVSARLDDDQAAQTAPLTTILDGDSIGIELDNLTAADVVRLILIFRATQSGFVTLSASVTSDEQAAATTGQADSNVEVDDVYYQIVNTISPLGCGLFGFASPLLLTVGLLAMKRRRSRF